MNDSINIKIVIWFSLFISLLLHSFALTSSLFIFKPNWLFIMTIYWALYRPDNFNLYSILIIGLLFDLFTGTLLGIHSFCFTITASIIISKSQLIKNLALWQQALIILALSLLYISLLFFLNIIIYKMITLSPTLFLSAMIDGILWIVIYFSFYLLKIN